MPINTGAIGIRPVTTERPLREQEGVQRRDEGTVAGFRPQTNVALRTAISDLAGTLERIATAEKLGMTKIPNEIGQIVKNILEQALSLQETLGKGVGSTIESQLFSMEQLSTFGRMLFQLGSLSDRGFSMKISPEIQTLLSQFKNFLVSAEGGNALEPVLMTKFSFELLDSKIPDQLPPALYEILTQLSQPLSQANQQPQGESDVMNFLNKLVKFFMPRPAADNAQPQQNFQQQQPMNQQQPLQQQNNFQQPMNQQQQPFQQQNNFQQPMNQQQPFQQNNFQQPMNQQQPLQQQNFQQPMNQQQLFQQNFQQPMNQQQPQQNFQQPMNQQQQPFQQNFQQPMNQQQPFQQQNLQQPMNQQQLFQQQQNFQQPTNQQQPFQQNFQQPMNQQQPFQQNFQQPMNQQQPQQNFQQPMNQQQPFQQNFQQPMNQQQPQQNFQQPMNQQQPQQNFQQPMNQQQPQQNFQQPMNQQQPQQNFQQPMNQQQPFQQNFQQPMNQQQPQQNFQQPMNQQQPQQNFQQPMNQQQPFQQNFQQPMNQQQPQQNFQQPMNQQQPQQNFQQPMNQQQPFQQNFQQPMNQQQPFQQNFQQPMNQQQPQQNFQQPTSTEELMAQQQSVRQQMKDAHAQIMRQPLENSPRTLDTMKNLARFLLQNTEMNPQDAATLQNFVNNPQRTFSLLENRHLQNLLRLCQQNVPATVRQAAVQQNLPDLPRLWAFMQLCDMAKLPMNYKGRQFRSAGKDIWEFSNSLRKSMSGDNFTAPVQNQRSFQMMVPIYLNVNEMSYPTYLNVYDESTRDNETGQERKETWVRICVLTDNIGAAELTFRIYEGNQLDMRFYFSQGETAAEFSTYVDELRNSLDDLKLQLGEIRIGNIGSTMEQY